MLKKIISYKINNDLIIKIAVLVSSLGYMLHFFYRLYRPDEFRSIIKIVAVIGLVLTLIALRKFVSKFDFVVLMYTMAILVWVSFTSETSFFVRFVVLIHLSMGLLAGKGKFSPIAAKLIFIIICGIIFYYYIIVGYDQSQHTLLVMMNRNIAAVYITGGALFLYIVDYISGKTRPVIWASALALWLTVFTQCRMATIISLLLLILVLFINLIFFNKTILSKIIKNIAAQRVVLSLFVVCSLIALFGIFISVYTNSRFSTVGLLGETSISRIQLYKDFFHQLTISGAITGFNFVSHEPNLHNSFLQLWSYCGIAAFPVFFFLIYILYQFSRVTFFIAGIFFLILLSSIPDSNIFIFYYDFLLFSLIFYYLSEKFNNDSRSYFL